MSRSETDDGSEQESIKSREQLREREIEEFGAPLARVSFEWETETLAPPTDCYVVHCPLDTNLCDEEKHRHNAHEHPRVALGGVSKAFCPQSGRSYYLVLRYQGRGVSYDVIGLARQELTNPTGDELREPLSPKGVDMQVIDELVTGFIG